MSVRWCPQGKAVQGFLELPLLFPGFPHPCSAVLSTTELTGSDKRGTSLSMDKEEKWLICQKYVKYIKKSGILI